MSDIKPNLSILIEQYDKEKEMKLYDSLHRMEKLRNYNNKLHSIKEDRIQLAEYIYKNYDTMDEIEMKKVAAKCMDLNETKKVLLSFELENKYYNKSNKALSLESFLKKATKLLFRYQCKAGGFLMDDSDWLIYRYQDGNNKYDLKKNELLFENTFNICDESDIEMNVYFDKIGNMLDSLSNNINIEIEQTIHEKHKKVYVTIKGIDTNMKLEDDIVGL